MVRMVTVVLFAAIAPKLCLFGHCVVIYARVAGHSARGIMATTVSTIALTAERDGRKRDCDGPMACKTTEGYNEMKTYYHTQASRSTTGTVRVLGGGAAQFDLLCTDPPYGLGAARKAFGDRVKRHMTGLLAGKCVPKRDYGDQGWDDAQQTTSRYDRPFL